MASERVSSLHDHMDRLLLILQENGGMPALRAEAAAHALVDISQSMDQIYDVLIPALLSPSLTAAADIKDRIWDLREELRHVDYHVHDSGLLDT
jgi:hypothetical protein